MNFIEKWFFKRGVEREERRLYSECVDDNGKIDWKKFFRGSGQ